MKTWWTVGEVFTLTPGSIPAEDTFTGKLKRKLCFQKSAFLFHKLISLKDVWKLFLYWINCVVKYIIEQWFQGWIPLFVKYLIVFLFLFQYHRSRSFWKYFDCICKGSCFVKTNPMLDNKATFTKIKLLKLFQIIAYCYALHFQEPFVIKFNLLLKHF